MISVIASALRGKTKPLAIPASLFYEKDVDDKGNKTTLFTIGAVEIDLILEEHHSVSAKMTTHSVELTGETIADHIQIDLRSGTLKALVSNYSLKHPTTITIDANTSAEDILKEAKDSQMSQNRAKEAWTDLKAILQGKKAVKIVTSLETYGEDNDVYLTDVSTMRNSDSGDALEFDISFQQIKTVMLSTSKKVVTVTKPTTQKTSDERKRASKKNNGTVVGKSTDSDGNDYEMESILDSMDK